MKIAMVISSLEAGGAQRVMTTLANHLSSQHEVVILALRGRGRHFELEPAVEVRELDIVLRSRVLRALTGRFVVIWSLRHQLKELSPQVTVAFGRTENIRTLLATVRTKTPVVISERSHPLLDKARWIHGVLRRFVYRRASLLIFQTERARAWGDSLGLGPSCVIPNAVDMEHRDTSVVRGMEIVALGRLSREKGFDLLLEAYARSVAAGSGWSLRLIGDGPEREALEKQAELLGVEGKVRFEGLAKDPRPHLRRAGIFVLASRYEGFPNALLEAMACGTPVVSFDCPAGPAEIVTDREDGLLVPLGDTRALADAIDFLAGDPELRRRLGEAARDRSRSFGTETVLPRWAEALASVVRATNS